jgi:hypothetical protein
MAKAKNGAAEKVQKMVAEAKTAGDLNRLISKYIDILENGGLAAEELKQIEMISGLIGRQVSVENAKISYERLAALNNKAYAFAAK